MRRCVKKFGKSKEEHYEEREESVPKLWGESSNSKQPKIIHWRLKKRQHYFALAELFLFTDLINERLYDNIYPILFFHQLEVH